MSRVAALFLTLPDPCVLHVPTPGAAGDLLLDLVFCKGVAGDRSFDLLAGKCSRNAGVCSESLSKGPRGGAESTCFESVEQLVAAFAALPRDRSGYVRGCDKGHRGSTGRRKILMF